MAEPKLPPYSIDAEQSVLGGICLRNSAFDDLAGQLAETDFYRVDHQLIFRAQQAMHSARIPIDFVTLSEHLRSMGKLEQAGGFAYIGSLARDTPSAYNVSAYAAIVRERSVLRQLIAAAQDISDIGFRPDERSTAEALEAAEQRVMVIRGGMKSQSDGMSYSVALDKAKDQMERNRQQYGCVVGLSTGLVDFDQMTSGLQQTDLIVIAGRPSMGKSTVAQNIADHVAASLGKRTAFFTMEMSAEQVAFRALANHANIPLQKLRAGQLSNEEWERVTEAEKLLRRAPMIIDETGGLSPMQLRAKARKYSQQADLGLIVVDYIQLMSIPGSKENRTGDVSEISRSLKAMAKELRIPVIALSQLNRKVEDRDNKRPRMADLRESGGIEQDADLIVMVYRDEVYTKEASRFKGTAELVIEKSRNGPLGTVRTSFQGELLRFGNLAHDWQPDPEPERLQKSVSPSKFGRVQHNKYHEIIRS